VSLERGFLGFATADALICRGRRAAAAAAAAVAAASIASAAARGLDARRRADQYTPLKATAYSIEVTV